MNYQPWLHAEFFMITLETKSKSFARCHFHIIERTLNIGNRYHFQGIVRRSQQIEITGIPDGRFENHPYRLAGDD